MITTRAIVDALCDRLILEYPRLPFYADFAEKNFLRPSFHVLADGVISERKITRTGSEIRLACTVIYHGDTDAAYRADRLGLYDVRDHVTVVLGCEYLAVGNRCVRIGVGGGTVQERDIYTDLIVTYTESTGYPGDGTVYDTIMHVNTKIKGGRI